jgi:hypothetical protein
VNGYAADQLEQALEGVEVVVIPAGVPRKVCSAFFILNESVLKQFSIAWSEYSLILLQIRVSDIEPR